MGIALGAGLGWLSGQYGYMVDNIISSRVVLADSSIITASESENSDLFWAIRGTGGGFGVVTELVFKAYDQGPVFAFVNISCPLHFKV
jgi:FAD/FMN-containing dehydrogenase